MADQLVAGGMRTLLVIGLASPPLDLRDVDAVVVALKTRTIDPAAAVDASLSAAAMLETAGVEQVLFKYCSTFDSTDRGNIGPVGDALAERFGQHVTVFCPAYPANGRTIFNGYLFVGDVLLSESSMRDHPLTPMRDPSLVRVLQRQSRRRAGLVGLADVRRGATAIGDAFARLGADGPAHCVVDIAADEDLIALGEALADTRFFTGGAGVALGLPAALRRRGRLGPPEDAVATPVRGGAATVLAGSASAATRAQVAAYRATGAPSFTVGAEHLADPAAAAGAIVAWAAAQRNGSAPLVAATAEPDVVRANQERYGVDEAGRRMETILASVARDLVAGGVRRLVVAGGETSGAVVEALGVGRLRVGPRIATGVPWTIADGGAPLGLALKSGNFGGPDFFARALAMTA